MPFRTKTGNRDDRSVEDVLIQHVVITLANEEGADSLKSQRPLGVRRQRPPPRLEIIFKRGQRSIPSQLYSVS
jgi:hypothetical protein